MGSYGRTLSGVTVASQSSSSGPILEYDFYAFGNLSSVPAKITLYISPFLKYLGPARPLIKSRMKSGIFFNEHKRLTLIPVKFSRYIEPFQS